MAECRVKKFTASWSNWDISWPGYVFKKATIRLPVRFELELDEGCTKADCVVGQEKRGRSEIGGRAGDDVWDHFVADAPIGERYWWDGEHLSNAGFGEWDRNGRTASFRDAPGFKDAPGDQSLYMGAAAGRTGYFDFRTFVNDRATGKTIRVINWSMRIDVATPGKGGFWWSFSDQK